MKILAIGNSFSEDATRYMHDAAKRNGIDLTTVNLFIGGCSFATHYKNMNNDDRRYDIRFNGQSTGFSASIKEGLQAKEWDVVTIQQASNFSFDYETYQPYAIRLVEYIKIHCPKAKIFVHETWGYESGSTRIKDFGFETYDEMFSKIKEAYKKLAEDVKADGIIPSGTAMQNMLKLGLDRVHRDGFHADLGYGRFALALTWIAKLLDVDVRNFDFDDFDVPVNEKEIQIAKEAAYLAVNGDN